MKEPWATDKWHVSYLNFLPEVREGFNFLKEVIISDCTLREGEQQAGVVLSPSDKLRLARELDEIGIPQLEVGMPAVSQEEFENVKAIGKAGLRAKTIALCRIVKEDVDKALECRTWGVSISIPIGYLQLKHKLKWPEEKIISEVTRLTQYAYSEGLYVVLSPYDTTRADLEFLERFLTSVMAQGHIDRVRVVDTVGSCLPQAIQYMVRWMARITKLPVEVHCHDDFGMATANTLAGIAAGANVASTALNGMGERAGGAPTEEVAMALQLLYGIDLGLKFDRFYGVSKLLQEMSRTRLAPHKAIVGENAFGQEAGLVVSGWKEMVFTAEPYLPELVGQTHKLILGKKSGKDSIEIKLKEFGLEANKDQLEEILLRVKLQAEKTKSPVSDGDFERIVREVTVKAGGKDGASR
jgi:isopropylmalate/homocitrate/citramalate synthase